jgi:nicotinamidase-related amidase
VSRLDPSRSALVLVDYQERLMPAIDDGARVLAHAVRLAQAARALGIAVLATEQNPQGLGANAAAVRTLSDATLVKMHFDACADGLLERLQGGRASRCDQVVIAGCEAHVCLMQTALGLLHAGCAVWVVAAACGSRRATDHALAMQRLRASGAAIASVEMVVFEWLRTCTHASFKPVLALMKPPLP